MAMQTCPRCGFRSALTVNEAAERLGVTGQTVRNWIKSGKLPGVETEPNSGSGFKYWIPEDVLDSDAVRELVEASTAIGDAAREGRRKAAAGR